MQDANLKMTIVLSIRTRGNTDADDVERVIRNEWGGLDYEDDDASFYADVDSIDVVHGLIKGGG